MKEHYVTYEQAVKLKELGFDWPTSHYYCAFDNETDVRLWDIHPKQSQNAFRSPKDKVIADAPRLDQSQAWLREVKEIDIEINAYQHLDGESIKHQYNFGVLTINGETFANTWYDNYEQALSDAIDTALELLTNKY